MHRLVFEVVEKAALAAGLPEGRVMHRVEGDNLTLDRPRLELAFLPELYRRTGRTLDWNRSKTSLSRKRELYEADLTVYANVFSEDEDWLSDFSNDFVAALPKGVNDRRGNRVEIRVEKATFSRPADKRVGDAVIEVFKKADKLFELKFTFRVTKNEEEQLIPTFNILTPARGTPHP